MKTLSRIFVNGAWYYTVTVVTAGLFAWVPFLHAGTKLTDNRLRKLAALYGVVAVVVGVLSGLTPTDAEGNATGAAGTLLSTVVALVAIAMITAACVQLRPARRAVYALAEPPRVLIPAGTDPAVAQVLAARERRQSARALVEGDPMLARELNIGRPDRMRNYDDGGLVDLNNAPVEVLMSSCGLSGADAERLVTARDLFPAGFSSIDELLVYAELSGQHADVLRDRGILLPR